MSETTETRDHWSGPLNDEAVADLLDAIEAALDDDTSNQGIVNALLFRNFRAHHVVMPELRTAIGWALAVVEAATDLCKSGMDTWRWDRQAIEVTTHYALQLAEASAACSAEQRALLAAVADGGE